MNRRRRCDRTFPSAIALIIILTASPALGLHLFLDSNGDGTRTAADAVNPHGTTHVTVWLVLDRYKEGLSDECSHGRRAGTHAYSIVFLAAGGTFAWGQFVSETSTPGQPPTYDSDDSTYLMVRGSVTDTGATQKVRLGTFSILVRRGRPSVEIVSRRPGKPFDETRIATGTWDGPLAICADGLSYGGQVNRPPSLTRLGDTYLKAGTAQRLKIVATDIDGDPLTFRLVQGVSYVSVATLNAGHGAAEAEISVVPDSCVRGRTECVIEVSDGFATDVDTMLVVVHPLARPLATSPMLAALSSAAVTAPREHSSVDSLWLVGEWEWHDSPSGKGWRIPHHSGPAQKGYRRRLVFHRNGEVEVFDIGSDGVLRALRGRYSVDHEPDGTVVTISNWFDLYPGLNKASFRAVKEGPTVLNFQHSAGRFIRVPSVLKDGAPTDTGKIVAPIEPPSVRFRQDGTRVTLSSPMLAALQKCDPAFRLWQEADTRALGLDTDRDPGGRGAPAIVGDFDGDMLLDVALLGRSGADQVVIAILSDHGNVRAVEVAWRKVRLGKGEHKTRGDPEKLSPVYLELAPRGSKNPFCWVPRWDAMPVDAIGIVEPGVGRFDYLLTEGRFAIFAPVP